MKDRIAHSTEAGTATVELALVAVLFVTLLMTILGFGHWMWTLEAVADATRVAARVAVVCDLNAATVKQAIQARVPQLSLATADISLQYLPEGCVKSNCQSVQVSVSGAGYASWMPFLSGAVPVPPFTTSLPRESLESTNAAGEVNPVCS
jgi:Flp pilus assembly protein TadG